jgi:phosphopantothenoylcysteine decarboxylase/phosphopantothenate--cysteine ligase
MTWDDRDVESKGAHLAGKRIDLIVSGGIAAIESPKIARELRRYGAEVHVIMTPAATQFVTPLTFEWASKNRVVTDLSGAAEHITHSDAVVVAPATLDFISKIALGLADSAAATVVQSAITRVPIFFAPAMHLSLQGNPAFAKHVETLSAIDKVQILRPLQSEGKAKMIDFESLVARMCHGTAQNVIARKKVLISLGPTRSYADDMRFLSNRSTGNLGRTIADEFFRNGANVYAICGPTQMEIPPYLNPTFVETNEDMRAAFSKNVREHEPDVAIFSAAVLDFEIANPSIGKFSSKESWSLQLKPSPKLIQSGDWPAKIIKVGFKLESRLSLDDLKTRAKIWAEENRCQMLVANRLEDVDENHCASIWDQKSNSFTDVSGRREIARHLVSKIREYLSLNPRI